MKTENSCIAFHRHADVPSIGNHQCSFALVEREQVLFLFTHSLQHLESKCQHTHHIFIHLVWHWIETFCLYSSLQVIAQLLR